MFARCYGWGAIRAKRGQFDPKFQIEWVPPTNHFRTMKWMPYNFVADIFTQRNFVPDFLQSKCDFTPKTAVLRFWAPFVGLRSNVRWSCYTNWKARIQSGLPIELFSLCVTDEALRANIGSKSAISLQRGPVDPKFQAEGVAHTNHFSSQKTRLNDLWYGVKIWTDLSSVLSQFSSPAFLVPNFLVFFRPLHFWTCIFWSCIFSAAFFRYSIFGSRLNIIVPHFPVLHFPSPIFSTPQHD